MKRAIAILALLATTNTASANYTFRGCYVDIEKKFFSRNSPYSNFSEIDVQMVQDVAGEVVCRDASSVISVVTRIYDGLNKWDAVDEVNRHPKNKCQVLGDARLRLIGYAMRGDSDGRIVRINLMKHGNLCFFGADSEVTK